MKNYKTVIHTGMYSDKAFEAFAALKRGIMRSSHRYTWFYRSLDVFSIDRSSNNEVIIATEHYSPYDIPGNEKKFKQNLAYKIKEFARKYGNWSRDNQSTVNVVSFDDEPYEFEIRTAYFIYDKLLNRPRLEQKYPSDFMKSIVSIPLDPITAEVKASHLEEIDKLTVEYENKITELKHNCWNEKDKACGLINDKYNHLIKDAKDELAIKIAAIKSSIDELVQVK